MVTQTRIPCKPGQPEIVDYEYERNGVANVFMISEPLARKRETIVKETRTAVVNCFEVRYSIGDASNLAVCGARG